MKCFLTPILAGVIFLTAGVMDAVSATESIVQHSERIYKTVGDQELKIHVFSLEGKPKTAARAAIVFFHGGGWASGDPAVFFGACRRYASMGLITFSVRYRLSRESEANSPIECVMDARSALRWVRGHAGEFAFDPEKIIVGGHSVGGHLTLACAMIDSFNEATDDLSVSPMPNAMLIYAGTSNTVEVWCDNLLGDRRTSIWAISPEHNMKSGLPPAIAFHGRDDHVVKFWKIRQFKAAMIEHGNHFELVDYPGRGHYLGEGNEKYASLLDEGILETTDGFLRRFGFLDAVE